MANLVDVLQYLCAEYPHKNDLSKARLTKMVYLADWRSAIVRGQQITDIDWVFNHYGPYVDTPMDEIRTHLELFKLEESTTFYGSPKTIIRYIGAKSWPSLSRSDIEILIHVIQSTLLLSWDGFLNLVYATYPIATQPRYRPLNLVELAAVYQDERKDLTRDKPL